MSVTDLGWRDSLNAVRGARNCASPNCGFQRQLLEFQHESLFQVRCLRHNEDFADDGVSYRVSCDLVIINFAFV